MAKIHLLHFGGGTASFGANGLKKFPQNLASVCEDGYPDWAHTAGSGSAYFGRFNGAFEGFDQSQVAVGDKLVVAIMHAGHVYDRIAVNNRNGCTGLQFHVELLDMYSYLKDGDAATVLHTLPVVNGATTKFEWQEIDGGSPVWGDPYKVETINGKPTAIRQHMLMAIVIDALPTAEAVSNGCASCGENPILGCTEEQKLGCMDVHLLAPTDVYTSGLLVHSNKYSWG